MRCRHASERFLFARDFGNVVSYASSKNFGAPVSAQRVNLENRNLGLTKRVYEAILGAKMTHYLRYETGEADGQRPDTWPAGE